jgi:hypothetical protein
MKIAIRMHVEKCVSDRVLCRLQMGGDAGTFATLSASSFHTPLNILREECNLLWVNFKLAAVHCCESIYSPRFQCCATTLAWCEEKDSKICTVPRNINSSVARSKSTDLAAMVIEERQVRYWELTDWLTDCSLWVVEHLCETWVWNWPCILTYTNWQRDFSAVCWEKNWMNGNHGNCLRFWYGKCIKWVKILFCCELRIVLKRGIFLHVDVLTLCPSN